MNLSSSRLLLLRLEDHIARVKIPSLVPCNGSYSSRAPDGCSNVDGDIEEYMALQKPSTSQWNAIIRAHVNSGHFKTALSLFCAMRQTPAMFDHFTLPLINRAISALSDCFNLGEAVHCLGIQMGFFNDVFFCNTMIEVYSKYGFISLAHQLFDEMPLRDVVSWTSLISGYIQIGDTHEAFRLFRDMRMDDLEPSSVTLSVILRACSLEKDVFGARQLQSFAVKLALESHELVQNSILTAFSKCGCLEDVNKLFTGMQERSVVALNILISGYSSLGDFFEVIRCYEKMKTEVSSSHETLTLVISAFAQSKDLPKGEKLHCYAIKSGQIDAILQTALIDFYTKCGELASSMFLFEEVKTTSSIAWSVMFWGLIQNMKFLDVIHLFDEMQKAGVEPCASTVKALVLAYTNVGALRLGKGVHGFFIRKISHLTTEDTSIATSILNMYAKCGSILSARRCFNHMVVKDIIAWSSMIEAYAVHGHGLEALGLFSRMQEEGIQPNSVTFISLLSACSHSGLVHEGREILDCMTEKFGVKPDLNHYTCMVDLLGRSGKLQEALEIINNMNTQPDGRIWGSLLASCRKYSDGKLGSFAARKLFNLESDNVGYHVVLSNILAGDELWDESEDIWKLMVEKGFNKRPGWSCIEEKGRVHTFVSGDRSHFEVVDIYDALENLARHIGESRKL